MRKLVVLVLLVIPLVAAAKDIDVRKYGAHPDGHTKATTAIQRAIDDVSDSGGGRVTLSGGTFLSGALTLKSGVELYVDADATLLASADINDFPMRDIRHCNGPEAFPRWSNKCFILADEAENIAIAGRGKIDCNGEVHVSRKTDPNWYGLRYERVLPVEKTLPRVVTFAGCKNITVRDITMVGQPGGWTFWILDCDHAVFDNCHIDANVEYPNNDGIHINSSRDISVSNCRISTGDDCIVVRALNRTLKESKVCENIVVSNCTLCSSCYGIRIGYVGDGTVRNCSFSNVSIVNSFNGIGIEMPTRGAKNDFGYEKSIVEKLLFSNIQMSGILNYPVEIYIADDETTPVECVRNICFANVQGTGYRLPSLIGTESHPLENIVFSNCNFTQIPIEECGCQWRRFTESQKKAPTNFRVKFCKGLKFYNTEINTL